MPELEEPAVAGDAPPEPEYQCSASSYDEMTTAEGRFRPHWQTFIGQIQAIGLPELRQRWKEAKHLIRENGVTYNVYGDPQGMDRPWELDPIPLLISPSDAAVIESGLVQRARLLDLILSDLYGPQRLLTSGILPPELVFGNQQFLRPCHGLKVLGNRYLHLYAADVGRAPDGSFFVLGDRTQAPSGAGYALENRIVLSRMLPEVFRDCQVQRLALFFRTPPRDLAIDRPARPRQPSGRAPDARALQRDVLRARLPGPLSRVHAGRGERPDDPRQPGLSEAARRPATGGRHPSTTGRRLLRPPGAPPRFVPRGAGIGPGPPGRERRDGERAGQRAGRDAGPARLPSRALPARPGRGAEDPVGPDLVVWRPGGAGPRPGESASDGHQADLRRSPSRPDLRRGAHDRAAPRAGREDPRPAVGVRRTGANRSCRPRRSCRATTCAPATSSSGTSWRPRRPATSSCREG